MLALATAATLALLGVLTVAIRRRALARIAMRGALRRKGETVLVVLGSLLGTAIITSSLLVGDTLAASFRASAPNQLGPTDVVVRSATPQAAAAAEDAIIALDAADDDIDGVLAVRTLPAAVATTDPEAPPGDSQNRSQNRRAEPTAQLLEVDFSDARAFGGDPAATGISGAGPTPGSAVISEDLARALQIGVDDRLEVYAYGQSLELEVSGVLPRTGVAGYWTGAEATSNNAFVSAGTIADLFAGAGQDARGGQPAAQPPADQILVSAAGGVLEGAERTAAVSERLGAALAGIEGVDIDPVKQNVLDAAETQGDVFGQLFLAIGSFAVLAGTLLLVNIFVMLAEERKSELGMLRAVGLRRSDLVRVFLIEGALYSVAAAALGALLGIGLARVIIIVTSGIFQSFGAFTLTFTVPAVSVAVGFLVGLLIALATIAATSVRISRINIIRAIRDLPEPALQRRALIGVLLPAAGAAVFGALSVDAINRGDALTGLAFPPLAGLSAALLGARFLPRRAVVSTVAAAVLVYELFADEFVEFSGGDINVFIVQGVALTAAAVALVGQNQELIGRGLRLLGGGRSLVVRLGLAYPLARRFRTSMTLAMYSLVVFTLVFISVLSSLFANLTDQQTAQEGGGFDIIANASGSNPLDPARLRAIDGVETVATLTVGGALFRPASRDDFSQWGIAGFDSAFVDAGPPQLQTFDQERYATEADVWRAVAGDPSLAIVDAFFGQDGGGPPERIVEPGDALAVRNPVTGEVSERTVAALSDAGLGFAIWMSSESVAQAVSFAVPSRYYLAVSQGEDAQALADRLNADFVSNGMDASTFRALVEENTQANNQFFRLMQGYLALGLVVGIAGLGVIMVRAVRERRRQIGMLRSLGFAAARVRSTFLLESGFVALEGIAIGTALALVTSYQIVVNSDALGDFDAQFIVPWAQLSVLLGTAFVASLGATAAPARQAARIRPAVALRIAD